MEQDCGNEYSEELCASAVVAVALWVRWEMLSG